MRGFGADLALEGITSPNPGVRRVEDKRRKTVVVVGNGMVGHRFCERLVEFDSDRAYRIVTFCEEPRPAYDRVHLTKYFEHRQAEKLALAAPDWYERNGIDLFVGDRATEIDRDKRVVRSARGREITYDAVVLATGSAPFVPPVPGIDKKGVFVYRTIEDLEKIIAYGLSIRKAAVIGGGLLGLEAAKAAYDLGLETHVVEFAPRLMPRQIDETGSRVLVGKINALGVQVHLNKNTKEILGNGKVEGMAFADGGELDVKMIVVSAGIKPRDDLARGCGLMVGQRGGVVVDDQPAHLRSGHLRHRRSRPLRRHDLRPRGARLRNGGDRGRQPARPVAHLYGGRHVHQAQADGRGRGQLRQLLRRRQDCQRNHLRRSLQGIVQEAALQPGRHAPPGRNFGRRRLGIRHVVDAGQERRGAGHAAERAAVRQERRGEKRRRRRRFHPQRRSGLLVQQRHQGADLRRRPRQEPHLGRGDQTVYAGRHGLRRLSAARHRPVQGPNQGVRQEGQQRPVRAFRLHATGIV